MLNRRMLSQRWKTVTPNLEKGTLRSRGTEEPFAYTAYSISHAHGGLERATASGGDPSVKVVTRRWQLWADALDAVGAPPPKKDDLWVAADGTCYTIDVATRALMGAVYLVDSTRCL